MESHTALLANRDSLLDPEKRRGSLDHDSPPRVIRRYQVSDDERALGVLHRVIEVLPAMKKPVGRLHGIDYFSIQTVVQKGLVNCLIPPLKAAGAEDILEIPITKIVR